MKVTQTEKRYQHKSYAKYKQTLGTADPIIVRRAVPFPNAVIHPSSIATKQQRQRLTRASKAESSALGSDKDLIKQAARLSLTGTGSQPGEAKVLTGRQAFVSQAIRDQQLGETVNNFMYPCFKITDRNDRPFPHNSAQFTYEDEPHYGPPGTQLLENDWIFVPFDLERPVYGFSASPPRGFTNVRKHTPPTTEILGMRNHYMNPNIRFRFYTYTWPYAHWYPWRDDVMYSASIGFDGLHVFARTAEYHFGPPGMDWCIIDFDIEYVTDDHWRYHFNDFDYFQPTPYGRSVGISYNVYYEPTRYYSIDPFVPFTQDRYF